MTGVVSMVRTLLKCMISITIDAPYLTTSSTYFCEGLQVRVQTSVRLASNLILSCSARMFAA
ncbi:hypothetical protein SAMN05444161_6966 [Rhizobiales bacterium GAS191]|nr:hypothetical protein SAMN05444161_6966 [Rhizobiales bacterium GAS191]